MWGGWTEFRSNARCGGAKRLSRPWLQNTDLLIFIYCKNSSLPVSKSPRPKRADSPTPFFALSGWHLSCATPRFRGSSPPTKGDSMRLAILSVLFCVFSVSAQARDWGGSSGRADYCTYQDKGWEEHWRGHDSCQDCLRKHGKCVETCYSKSYKVKVTGSVRDYWNNSEREEEFLGYGESEWRAESEAIQACQYRNASNCQVANRDTESREISRSTCAK